MGRWKLVVLVGLNRTSKSGGREKQVDPCIKKTNASKSKNKHQDFVGPPQMDFFHWIIFKGEKSILLLIFYIIGVQSKSWIIGIPNTSSDRNWGNGALEYWRIDFF